MDSIQQLLTITVAVIAIATALAVALVIFRGSYSRARIDALVKDVEIYKNRDELKTKQLHECEERITLLEEKVVHLEDQNSLLREEVTQKARVEELAAQTREMHYENLAMCEQILVAVQGLRT